MTQQILDITPGAVILSGIVGSTAHGMARNGSDVDRLGVFVAPTRAFHGLELPGNRHATVAHRDPDIALHEIRKLLLLLLRANPTVTELLWLPPQLYEIRTEWGEELIANRHRFLCAPRVADAYLGYAAQQLGRLREAAVLPSADRTRAEKHGRHVVRLLEQGRMLYTTGELTVQASDPDACFVWGQRLAADPDAGRLLLVEARRVLAQAPTGLPPQPDLAWADQWLVSLRDHF